MVAGGGVPVAGVVGACVGVPGARTVPPPVLPLSCTGLSATSAAFRAAAAYDCGTTRLTFAGSVTAGYCTKTMFDSPTFLSARAISTSAVGLVRVSDRVTFFTAALARE